jgi:class 3 adenylate cyclase
LILHSRKDALVPVENGRYLASQIPSSKYIEYPEGEHGGFLADGDFKRRLCGDIEEFITGNRGSALSDLDRVLATVLFTDIVDSTHRAAQMGDHSWRHLLDEHDRTAERGIEKHRGNLIKTTGDGILSRRSTDQHARFGARWHLNQRQCRLVYHCGLASTPAKLKWGTEILAVSQFTLQHE